MADADPDLGAALDRLERIIGTFENEPDIAVRERVIELLEAVDAVHRPLVWRVGEQVHSARPELFEHLLEDPIASVLFEMYGLVSPKRREGADARQQDANEDVKEQPVSAFIGLGALEATVPVPLGWFDAAPDDAVLEGDIIAREVEGERLVLVRLEGALHAFADVCPGTPMPLNPGQVRDGVLLCPWHDCRYDVRTGRRLDREGAGLTEVPVAVRDGSIRVALRPSRRSAA